MLNAFVNANEPQEPTIVRATINTIPVILLDELAPGTVDALVKNGMYNDPYVWVQLNIAQPEHQHKNEVILKDLIQRNLKPKRVVHREDGTCLVLISPDVFTKAQLENPSDPVAKKRLEWTQRRCLQIQGKIAVIDPNIITSSTKSGNYSEGPYAPVASSVAGLDKA